MKLLLLQGDGESRTIGGKNPLTLACNGSLGHFKGIYIDGVFIPGNSLNVKSGSTIVMLPGAYINKLQTGSHTFQFAYDYGKSPVGKFKMVAAAGKSDKGYKVSSKAPKTGDAAGFILTSGRLFMMSTLALYSTLRRRKEDK